MTPDEQIRPYAADGHPTARLIRSSLVDGADLGGIGPEQHELVKLLEPLPELARQLLDANFGAVTVLNTEGRVIDMIYAGISAELAAQIGDPPRGVGVLGRLGESGGPLRLEHISSHSASYGMPEHHPPMDALLGVRVSSNGDSVANLYVARSPGRPGFTDEDEQRILTLASYARVSLDNVELFEGERRLRSAAEASERRLAAVIRGSSAGTVVKDAATGRFVEVSGTVLDITGIDFSEHPNSDDHPFERLYHYPDGTPMPREEIPMNIALREHRSVEPTEVLYVRADGTRLPVLASAAPVFNVDGEIDSAICVFVDVSKMKEAEQAKADFLSMITHDLRTPLTTIKGMAAAALDATRESNVNRAIDFLEPIDDEVDYLADLISNLLDMTRIEAGADVMDKEVCHLADIAQDSLARINRSREAQGRYIHVNVAPDLPAVYADPGQIGRVFDNLLSNALKYSYDRIGVTARMVPGENFIQVEVDDHGPGIPEEHREAIFDRFARIRGAARGGRQGSGLGLAICKSIVNAHSGKIGVRSSDRGSVFWFTLPIDVE